MGNLTGRIKRESNDAGLKLPRIGKIKIGHKVKNARGKEYPQSTDYFICDSEYARFFTEAYGEKPNKIQIVFLSDSFSDSCFERYECRDNEGRKTGEGDGESWFVWDAVKEDYVQVDPVADRDRMKRAGKWYVILTIKFIIPAIKGVFGMFEFSTKGEKSTIPQIRDTFDNVLQMAGTVINIPFDLMVQKVTSQKPGSKSRYPVVSLVANLGQENLQMLKEYMTHGQDNIKQLGLLTEDKIKMLTDGSSKS